ncbi:universal stress protein [Gynurincola endophyticus]|uniref:universal stress protein n=1 Tax=Gynurincola endophyticus TaxID=2479004 RepID=UPI000F8D8686|nr:universal stress protein [Gynurincola endophyticus]
MNTIIITTDFSAPAMNAVKYAAKLAQVVKVSEIIVYHSYHNATASSDVSIPITNTTLAHEASMLALEITLNEIKNLLNDEHNVSIEAITNKLPLESGVQQLVEQRNAGLVVAGATGKSNLEKFLVGSNTVALADSCTVPLLIIPDGYSFLPIRKIVFACDLKQVNNNTPVSAIAWWLKSFEAKLLVLNVALKNKAFSPQTVTDQYKMHAMLDVFNPDYHYTEGSSIVEEITTFSEKESAGLIITIPKSYGFFEGLFKRSISKGLTGKTETPLLILRDVQ